MNETRRLPMTDAVHRTMQPASRVVAMRVISHAPVATVLANRRLRVFLRNNWYTLIALIHTYTHQISFPRYIAREFHLFIYTHIRTDYRI